ncbi:hypothetical protein G9U51_12080 [Calidifontibacter sp. DB0510]|uniref:DUF4232 domain-containing protein n=1 Tax=Metallococcus carri TaxID=1656884 RepID=A0A967B6K8_9MICO|nr:hypothetical protein [Metallococcus carri]NHN56517.1 hypothetical protein [Metallococcus carri]NOP38816.1 hypothetical protein [Calidifontibacter sp. DB2511S]
MDTRPSRRTLAKGLAWTVPALAVGAPAAQAAASGSSMCNCLKVGSIGSSSLQVATTGGVGTGTGSLVFNLDTGACTQYLNLFNPAYTIAGTGGRIYWNTGATNDYTVGATSGTGTIGQLSGFTSTFTVVGSIPMPNGGGAFTSYTPKYPTAICFTFTAIFVGLNGFNTQCYYRACFNTGITSGTGAITAGTGTVNYSFSASSVSLTTCAVSTDPDCALPAKYP